MYPSKPTLSYEQAAETAEELYEEYRKKQKAFEDRYGGLENPELYYGWKQRGDELAELKERYGKMLSYMDRHYMEMEVEPTFTFSGTAADVTPYQQQIGQMLMELEDYVSASKGLPDPSYVRQQQTSIARLQAALDTQSQGAKLQTSKMQGALSRTGTNPAALAQNELPRIQAEERTMLERSLNQIVLGNYSDDVTLLGTLGQFLLGMTGADILLDARDLTYDLTHLNEVPAWQVLVDAVGLIPVVGALKNVDEVAALVKAFRQGENLLGGLTDGARAGSRLALAGAGAAENAGTLNRVSESFDAAADTARGNSRLTEAGDMAMDNAKAAGSAGDRLAAVEEVVDSGRKAGYTNSANAAEATARAQQHKTVVLPKNEYAHVMGEVATNLTENQKNAAFFKKAIGPYIYTFENLGFGNYRVIGKRRIRNNGR